MKTYSLSPRERYWIVLYIVSVAEMGFKENIPYEAMLPWIAEAGFVTRPDAVCGALTDSATSANDTLHRYIHSAIREYCGNVVFELQVPNPSTLESERTSVIGQALEMLVKVGLRSPVTLHDGNSEKLYPPDTRLLFAKYE